MGRVSTCQKNCNTIDLRGAQVNKGEMIEAFIPVKLYKTIQHL